MTLYSCIRCNFKAYYNYSQKVEEFLKSPASDLTHTLCIDCNDFTVKKDHTSTFAIKTLTKGLINEDELSTPSLIFNNLTNRNICPSMNSIKYYLKVTKTKNYTNGIKDYFRFLKEQNNEMVYTLKIVRGFFRYLFFVDSFWKKTWEYNRKIIFMDGTFLKRNYKGILFIASTLNADNKLTPLAIQIAESESTLTWTMFLRNMVEAYPDLESNIILFISDNSKGLSNAIRAVCPNSVHNKCIFHIINNIKRVTTVTEKMEQHILLCAGSLSKSESDNYLRILGEENPEIRKHLEGLDFKTLRLSYSEI